MNTTMYSSLISPESYNKLMGVHRYIPESDNALVRILRMLRKEHPLRVLEVGCGPARILPALAQVKNISLYGLDTDKVFLAYARAFLDKQGLSSVRLIESDVLNYSPETLFDIIISQGFHHHLGKERVASTLQHIADILQPDGFYILSDEFLPPYHDSQERNLRVIVWYAHIIASALADGQPELAYEEAKTLLDDLGLGIKTSEQVEYVLRCAPSIEASSHTHDDSRTPPALAQELLAKCREMVPRHSLHDPLMELSRGDYKIDHLHFFEEITAAGLEIVTQETYGPVATVGGMTVSVLRKKAARTL